MELGIEALRIDNMWETDKHISGVPPHVKQLAGLSELKEQLKATAESIFTRIMESTTHYFETRRIGGGEITEERLMELIRNASNSARTDMQEHLQSLFSSLRVFPEQTQGDEGEHGATSHSNSLPSDFVFPSSTILDLWKKWHVGNNARGIPPLKELQPTDVKFLDETPLSEGERHREKHLTDKRRPAGKTLCDIRFICKYIEEQASLHHGFTEITELNVIVAFKAVTSAWDAPLENLPRQKRFEQLAWWTVIKLIRERKKTESQGQPPVPFVL